MSEASTILTDPAFIRRLDSLYLLSRKVLGGSLHADRRTTKKGTGITFADYAEYYHGADYRSVDWRVFARFEALVIKLFELEEDTTISILLDCSHSMASKFLFARQLAAALGYIALNSLDRLAVFAMGETLARLADVGQGRYYETDSPENVPRIFTKETMQASRSAIKEDVFGAVQTGDHPILSGYARSELPFIFGYVMTKAKPTAQLLLATEAGDPLLAVSRYGLGTGLAYTSDLTERWGGQWLAWDGCGRFWAQALRGAVRHRDVAGLRVVDNTTDGTWKLNIERVDERGVPVTGIQWDAAVLSADGKTEPVGVEQVGLGAYAAQVPLDGRRRLTLRLRDRDYDKMKVQHFHAPYPAEYELARTVPEPLTRLTAIESSAIRADLPPQRRRGLIQDWTCFVALACLLGGILLRRV